MELAAVKQGFNEYLTVKEAAKILGVSTWTLRNWDKSGKLTPMRHPVNGYRMYRHEDLQTLLQSGNPESTREDLYAPQVLWNEMGGSKHFVQFYENDDVLVNSVSEFIGVALEQGKGGLIVGTREHRDAIEQKLQTHGINVSQAKARGQLVCLDAQETLSTFQVGTSLDPTLFKEVVGGAVARLASKFSDVRAFGEMVALLWAAGNRAGAIQLEELWNQEGKVHTFSLFCAYPLKAFADINEAESFSKVCGCHSQVIPMEQYTRLVTRDERMRAISALQQQGASLKAEIEHRKEVEKSLLKRENELKHADRRKDEFLATLAHELRNPLAPINNALLLLESPLAKEDIKKEANSLIQRQVHQMKRLIDDLMDASRITQGKVELQKSAVPLHDVIQAAVELARPLIITKNHTLTLSEPGESLWVEADSLRLSQILSNLLNNAAKYTDTGGHIELSVIRQGKEVAIHIKDNGIGIPENMLAHIFDMFTQVDNSLERSQGGLGIGLTLVKELVKLHEGRVEAMSEGQGKGSEFVVHLPLTDQEAQKIPDSLQLQEPQQKYRVLVVDDNEPSAKTLGWTLELIGHEVTLAHDSHSALKKASGFKPDIILLDIGLPGTNGYDLCKIMREQPETQDAFIIAQTGWGQEEHRKRSKEAGFDHHLVKPIDMQTLENLLNSLDKQG